MQDLLNKVKEDLQKGKMNDVVDATTELVNLGAGSKEILDTMLEAMGIIGEKFKNNQVFVPEVLIAARAMNAGLEVIKPLLESEGVEPIGTVVIGTIKGDLHDIGKNLVRMMLVGAGFEVIDLGTNCGPEKFIPAIKEHNPDILCMSALLTSTMVNMESVIKALEDEGLRAGIKVMVGGAPITDSFAASIGADKYTVDAPTAATEAKKFVV